MCDNDAADFSNPQCVHCGSREVVVTASGRIFCKALNCRYVAEPARQNSSTEPSPRALDESGIDIPPELTLPSPETPIVEPMVEPVTEPTAEPADTPVDEMPMVSPVSEAMAEPPALLPHHLEMLTQGSGISMAIVQARGYRSISGPEGYSELQRLGFSRAQVKHTPGLLIPILGLDGQPVLYQYRPDDPRINTQGKPIKYETPKGATMRLDFGVGPRERFGNPAIPLWLTEGPKKGDALYTHALCTIDLLGVWNWRGSNVVGGKVALPDWEQVALHGRDVYIVFDSDVTTKPEVQQALTRFRRFLVQRGARPVVVLLPSDGPQKVGVDDFLLSHTVEELQALAAPHPPSEEAALDAIARPYRATSNGLVWDKPTPEGSVPKLLTNFTAQIVSDIIADDGAETARHFELEASFAGRTRRFTVPAAQFPALGWVPEHLGAQAIVYPWLSTKDHARAAIQLLSEVIAERRIFTHTGWRRVHDGGWLYFHGGGVLGANGVVPNMTVELPNGLDRLILPDPPTGPGLVTAIRKSVSTLDLAPDHITVPLWAAIWRAVLGNTDFGVHLSGPTGAGKSELATLAQQHFGADFDARHLPASWLTTGNSLEDLAFTAKDTILVIDDFAPGGTTADITRAHRDADRVLRAQGNRAGRQRMRADGTLRPVKPPRGLILSTGEEIPRGQSVRARVVIIEVSPRDIEWPRLTQSQQDAAVGWYVMAMAGYVRWLSPRYDRLRQELSNVIADLKGQMYRNEQHRRSVANFASLAAGVKHFMAFAQEVGALTAREHEELWNRCWTALLHMSAQQARYQEASEPTRQFLRLLAAAISSWRAHLASPTGGAPAIPQAYGWKNISSTSYDSPEWQPQGRRIGWIDGDDLYLEPEASYAEAQALASQQGDAIVVTAQPLRKRLHERRLLVSTGKEAEGRDTLMVRRTLEGKRHDVLHVSAKALESYTSHKPGHPDRDQDAATGGQAKPDHWSGNGQPTDHEKSLSINDYTVNARDSQGFSAPQIHTSPDYEEI